MLLQLLLGGLAGAAVSIKLFGRRIWRTLAFWRRDDEDEMVAEPDRESAEDAHEPTEPDRESAREREPV